ncbi:MAG: ABC transporter permease subunit [Phycisphaera sp.]|nr:ABC transporter permease subunit [Phycisphaera sp.]
MSNTCCVIYDAHIGTLATGGCFLRTAPIKSQLKFVLGVLLMGVASVACVWLLGVFFRPNLTTGAPHYEQSEIDAAVKARDISFDPNNPLVLHRDVDYSQGASSTWWPRGEAPVLKTLVDEGKLPPVAQRVGPEPIVMTPVDGVRNYGGTWMRLAISPNDVSVITWRLSYAALVRWSPYGYPIKPHLAKSVESSPDKRVWTVTLRRGIRWSDGEPFTADDIMYWWQDEVLDESLGSGDPPDWMKTQGKAGTIEKIDDYTLRFTFPEPHGLFLERLAKNSGSMLTPRHYKIKYHPTLGDPAFLDAEMKAFSLPSRQALYGYIGHFNNPEHPRLWPWIAREFRTSPPYVYYRNPYYYVVDDRGNQLPYVDRLQFEVADAGTMALKFSKGYTSMQTRHVRYENVTELMDRRREYGTRILFWYPASRSNWVINPNNNRAVPGNPRSLEECPDEATRKLFYKQQLLSNKVFRQALSLAIDRAEIIKAEYNNQTRPSQVSPGAESPFHHEKLANAFIKYAPERAGAMLDSIGLTRRDIEGMRTFPDGSSMTFFLDFSPFTGVGPAEFIVDQWADVGIRLVVRERSRSLFYNEKNARDFDFNIWSAESDFFPVIQPRYFAPPDTESFWAVGWGRWYELGGFYDSPRSKEIKSAMQPPKDHPIYAAYVALENAMRATSLDAQVEAFKPALDIAAENLWTINISEAPPQLVVVADGFRNVPHNALYAAELMTPGNAGIETYAFESPKTTQATERDTLEQLRDIKPMPRAGGTSDPVTTVTGRRLSQIVRWTVIGIVAALLLMVAVRHPFIAHRLLIMVPTLLVISVVIFTIIQLPPGDFLTSRIMQLQETGDEQALRQIMDLQAQFHFDEPVFKRYLRWMGFEWFITFDPSDEGLLQGNLGRSMETTQPVASMVGDRILLTMAISAGTILFTWMLAIPIGIYSAVRQYSISDYVFTLVGFVGMSVPGFLLALVLGVMADVEGLFSPQYAAQVGWTWDKFFDLLQHIWVPIIVMGVTGTAGMIRIMRANLLDELKKPYVTTARAKGVRPIRLLLKYPVRVALNPFISGIGHIFPQLVSGGAIVAMVLSLPTVGPLLLSALFSEDMYLAGSMLMVLSLLGVLGTLVSDLLLLWLDPRIRYERAGG